MIGRDAAGDWRLSGSGKEREVMALVERLPEGPVDVVGDIHGEIDALRSLMAHLGYEEGGRHPAGRQLVFVGDLVDRGPDSVAVVLKVKEMVEAGYAFAVLGNHEMNLLLDEKKKDNTWALDTGNVITNERPVSVEELGEIKAFLAGLPLALERSDLRIVHACWSDLAVERVRKDSAGEYDLKALSAGYAKEVDALIEESGFKLAAEAEKSRYAAELKDESWDEPVFLPSKAAIDEIEALENPIKVLTCGEEVVTNKPFLAGGKWRMVERCKWWLSYRDEVPVIVGHYWRPVSRLGEIEATKFGPTVFEGLGYFDWLGVKRNVFCVDYCVAARAKLRKRGADLSAGKLGALRVPEWRVVTDTGDDIDIGAPGVVPADATLH